MIKIRYADLPGGLHARAEARGRHTVIIYLLPGLTVSQRRAVLRRLRSSAQQGHGPLLSRTGIARAMVTDRIRTNFRNAAAALRVHPGMLTPPLVLTVAAAVAFVLLVPVPVGINSAPPGNPGASFRQPPSSHTRPPSKGHPGLANHHCLWVQLAGGTSGRASVPRPGKTTTPKPTASATPQRSPSPSASPSPSPSASPAHRRSRSDSQAQAAPSSASSPASSGTSASDAGPCVYLVLAGTCL